MATLTDLLKKFLGKESKKSGLLDVFYSINSQLLKDLENELKTYAQKQIVNFSSGQDYNELKRRHDKHTLFTDTEFPAKNSSVYYSNEFKVTLAEHNRLTTSGDVIWRRAGEFAKKPKFVNGSVNSCDLSQGFVGNCWFVAAVAGILDNADLFQKVVPLDNSFEEGKYCGLFHFRFWIYGKWYDVCVDDYLPIGPDEKLNFCHNQRATNEFWCALLEKAYVKVYGSYESLDGGFTTTALVDMSGGVEESFDLREVRSGLEELNREQFWHVLVHARQKHSVVCCNLELEKPEKADDFSTPQPNGLVRGHAYILSSLATVPCNGCEVRLVKCFNPWANDIEWRHDWSKGSELWKSIHVDIRKSLEKEVKNKGHFWMSYKDWIVNFDLCQIVNLTPDSIINSLSNTLCSTWQSYSIQAKWISGLNSGGCGHLNEEKYWTNPQFLMILADDENSTHVPIIISLMQKTVKKTSSSSPLLQHIQFRIFTRQVDANKLERVGSSGAYVNKREVTRRFHLRPGLEYLIIPSLFDENVDVKFLLRVFAEKPLKSLSPFANN